MSFKSTKVVFKGEDPTSIEGNLTMLGVTKPVTLHIDRWKCGPDIRTQGKRYQCGGNASGAFKRSDFGMKFGLPAAIGDEVKLWMSFTSSPMAAGRPNFMPKSERLKAPLALPPHW